MPILWVNLHKKSHRKFLKPIPGMFPSWTAVGRTDGPNLIFHPCFGNVRFMCARFPPVSAGPSIAAQTLMLMRERCRTALSPGLIWLQTHNFSPDWRKDRTSLLQGSLHAEGISMRWQPELGNTTAQCACLPHLVAKGPRLLKTIERPFIRVIYALHKFSLSSPNTLGLFCQSRKLYPSDSFLSEAFFLVV